MDQMTIVKRCLEWLFSGERRTAERQEVPHLVAHYWDGAAPVPHDIRNISLNGLYLVTEQRWHPGTLVMISLQKVGAPETDPDRTIMVNAKVVRADLDGVGFALLLPENQSSPKKKSSDTFGADRKSFHQFLRRLHKNRDQSDQHKSTQGQALIEYILVLPLIFLLMVNLVNFGGFFFAWITVANAARAGADYAVLAGASVGAPGQPNGTQIGTVITQDMSSLPNRASLAVNVCQRYINTVTTLSGTCSGTLSDPETSFTLMSIDVTYTYVPFISAGFKFPNLNIYATIPPTTIHRQAVMRLIQ
jgi:Flp pilus assembly protein TadG